MAERREPTIRVMLLPKDTNGYGTIFGGVIMSHMDLAGAAEARRHTQARVVTVAVDRVEFLAPVFVGDVVSYYTRLERVGTSSLHVAIDVEAERGETGERVKVTEARVVYVAVDSAGRPVPAGGG